MELKENGDIVNFITLLSKGIKQYGLKEIIKGLQKFNLINLNMHHLEVIDFIENSICKRYNIEREQLYNINTRGDITLARKLCALFLDKHLNMSDEEIGSHYNRTRQMIYHIKAEFKKLSVNNRIDAEFINAYNEFDTKIQDYIVLVKTKTNE